MADSCAFTGISGVHPLYFIYNGEPKIQLKEIWFEEKDFKICFAECTRHDWGIRLYFGGYLFHLLWFWCRWTDGAESDSADLWPDLCDWTDAVPGLRLYFTGFLIAGVNVYLIAYYSATGREKPVMIGSILRGMVLIAGFAVLFGFLFGMNGIWLSYLAAEAGTLLVLLMMQRVSRDDLK